MKALLKRWWIALPIAARWLLVTSVGAALAWAAYTAWQTYAAVDITVKAAPQALVLLFNTPVCRSTAGDVVAGPAVFDTANGQLTCPATNFDDEAIVEWGLRIRNSNTFAVSVAAPLPADTACLDFEAVASPPSIPADTPLDYLWRVSGIPGATGTESCAGQALGPFSVDITITKP